MGVHVVGVTSNGAMRPYCILLSHLHLHLTFTFRSSPSQLSGSGPSASAGRLPALRGRARALSLTPRVSGRRGGGRGARRRRAPGRAPLTSLSRPWAHGHSAAAGCGSALTKGALTLQRGWRVSRAGRRWGVHTVVDTVAESADRDPARRRAGPARTVVRGDRATRRVLPAGRGATPTAADRRTS